MKFNAPFTNPPGKNQEEYIRRINKAIEFIHAHLDKPIQLDDVACAGHFSPYHFHRIFHGIVGETVNDFITRKRMELAAKRLVYNPTISITEVAQLGGFSSSANFSKAFKLYFGLSPREVRDPTNEKKSKIGKLYSKYGKAFDPREMYSQFALNTGAHGSAKLKEISMNIKIKQLPATPIAYLSSPRGYELESLYETWDKLLNWAEVRKLDTGFYKRFAICHDNPSVTPENKCRYDATIMVDEKTTVSPPFASSIIPAGQYAVSYFKDTSDKINSFMTELCAHAFPQMGYEPDNFPPMFQYLNDSKEDDVVEMDVYVKVKAFDGTGCK